MVNFVYIPLLIDGRIRENDTILLHTSSHHHFFIPVTTVIVGRIGYRRLLALPKLPRMQRLRLSASTREIPSLSPHPL